MPLILASTTDKNAEEKKTQEAPLYSKPATNDKIDASNAHTVVVVVAAAAAAAGGNNGGEKTRRK
jgi:hypothetical protein